MGFCLFNLFKSTFIISKIIRNTNNSEFNGYTCYIFNNVFILNYGNSRERIQKRKKIDEERQQMEIELKKCVVVLVFQLTRSRSKSGNADDSSDEVKSAPSNPLKTKMT